MRGEGVMMKIMKIFSLLIRNFESAEYDAKKWKEKIVVRKEYEVFE